MPGSPLCRFAAVLALALCPAPAAQAATPRVVGGEPAARPYPFMAHVELHYPASSSVGYCGGSLIAARYVLTAGHCLEDAPSRIDVAVGVSRVDHENPIAGGRSSIPPENQFPGAQAIVHPGFGFTPAGEPQNDVALLVLSRPAPQEQLRLVRPGDAGLWAPGVTALALGWGRTCNPLELLCSPDLPDDLQQVAQPVLADAACQSVYGAGGYTPATMLCAGGEPRKDTCQGDSGGPLLVAEGPSFALIGATSFGPSGCGTGEPAAYARVGGALNAFVRAHVPQVEIDADVAEPVPGQEVGFTALPSRPGGGGPYGGYDELSWDLDGDGAFGEAAGRTQVARTMRRGTNTIAVRAAGGAGDAEVRTVRVPTVDRSIVAFARDGIRVREGRTARVRLRRVGVGTGSVTVSASGRRAPRPVAVTFGEGQRTGTAALRIPDDRRVEDDQALRLHLGGFTGVMGAGSPATATLTVADDDAFARLLGPRRVRVRGGRFAVRVRTDRPGRLRATAHAGGRVIARGGRRVRRAGNRSVRLRVREGAPHRRARLTVVFDPSGRGRTLRLRRALSLAWGEDPRVRRTIGG